MNEENNWKEFSDDISNISKKIKSSITDEENIEDLKNSLKGLEMYWIMRNIYFYNAHLSIAKKS